MLTIKFAAEAIGGGITPKQIHKWLERGDVALPHLKTGSQGVPAQFSDYDLCYLALVNAMVVDLGMSVKVAAEVVDAAFETAGLTPQTEDLPNFFTDMPGIEITRESPYRGKHATMMITVDTYNTFVPILERAEALRDRKRIG